MSSKATHIGLADGSPATAGIPGAVVVVEVRHLDTDSFSRSVSPTATRAWRRLPTAIQWETRYVSRQFAMMTDPNDPRVCLSLVAFGPTRSAARTALLDYKPRTFAGAA